MKYFTAVLVVALMLLPFVCSCDSKSPTSPSPNPSPSYTTAPGGEVSLPPPLPPSPPVDDTAGWVSYSEDGKTVVAELTAGKSGRFGLCIYTGPMGDPANQELYAEDYVELKKDDSGPLEAALACGVENQYDFVYNFDCPKHHAMLGERRIAGDYAVGSECPPPPPTRGCVPLPCPDGQVFDKRSCACTVIPPPPGCPIPQPPYECEDQTWLDFPICRWIGDCPPPPQCELECEFGYELNEVECKCEPEAVCHVSNKGKDGNWNIQEHKVKYNPGHASHFDNCPPDYFGQCDGRFDNGAPCQEK